MSLACEPLQQSPRARAVDVRTYCRPLDEAGSSFETRAQMLRRSMFDHHRRLLADAGRKNHKDELQSLERLGVEGKATVAGRTQWLGGTPYAYERAACMFNCSATEASTVYDLVDISWLLLNGCGVGFKPRVGTLHGYVKPIPELVVVPSTKPKEYKGREHNEEELPTEENDYTWTVRVGDSAVAWAKAGGKLFTPRHARRLVLDFSDLRGPGGRLRGYGWIANGYRPLATAFSAIHSILNQSAGHLLDEIQITDIVNWWGTVLSSRRAAEISLLDMHNPRIEEFVRRKRNYWENNPQRRQSNDTVLAWSKPSKARITELLHQADECGGDPAICNAEAAQRKAPWFQLFNPCVTGDTLILTRQGERKIEELVGRTCEVWNGLAWSFVRPRVTAHNQPLVRVTLESGRAVYCTRYHAFHLYTGEKRTADNLYPGDLLEDYVDPQGDTHEQRVASVENIRGLAEKVYCFNEPLRHRGVFNGILTGQCAEILLPRSGFCVSGDTLLITRDGVTTIKDAVGSSVNVWNGESWSKVEPRITGYQQELLRVRFGDGSQLDCTPYHRFSVRTAGESAWREVQAKDLMSQGGRTLYTEPFKMVHDGGAPRSNAYTLGVVVGDGGVDGDAVRMTLYGAKMNLPVVGRFGTPFRPTGYNVDAVRVEGLADYFSPGEVLALKEDPAALYQAFGWDRKSILEFVAGWLDADGSDTPAGGVRLYVSGYERACVVQLLLRKCGIRSSVNLMQKTGARTNYGLRTKDMWYLQVTECQDIPCHRLDTSRGHEPVRKGRLQSVRSVEKLPGRHTVYCFNEPRRHKAVFNNTLTYQCNLVTSCLPRFRRSFSDLERAVHLIARANYRQTCVDLRDELLQPAWHQTNESLRLCGVSMTGIVQADWMTDYQIRRLRNAAVTGAYSMADELKLPRPKAVTTVKPEGTISKTLGSTDLGEIAEGVHKPLGRFIFNWINFSQHDPLVALLESAGYRTLPNPSDPANVLVCFPVEYKDIAFDRVGGKEVNLEPATAQLDRYLRWNTLWADHNVSCTVSYSPEEIPHVADWLDRNWDRGFVAVSFLRRNDPTKTARDLGHPYLPQEVVTEGPFREYQASLRDVDWGRVSGIYEIEQEACATGACPVR